MDFTPLMIINGWLCLFLLSKTSSTGLDAARITLWDSIWVPSSQAKVTSLKSLSSRSFWKAEFMLVWKSFHWRQSCSDSIFADFYFLCAQTLGTEKGQGWVVGWVVCFAKSCDWYRAAHKRGWGAFAKQSEDQISSLHSHRHLLLSNSHNLTSHLIETGPAETKKVNKRSGDLKER